MAMTILENVKLGKESSSFVDSLHAITTAAGIFHGPKYMMAGMTGWAFKFVAHKRLLPSSIDMFSWGAETFNGINRLGIYHDQHAGFTSNPVFPLEQKHAIRRIRESLDRGVAVLSRGVTVKEFAVIHGYDDEDQVLFCKERGRDDQVILYQNFGKLKTACWYYSIIGEKVELDVRDIYRNTCMAAVDEWEAEYQCHPQTNREYASGRKAYEYLLHALQSGDFHEAGALRMMQTYVVSKRECFQFLTEVVKELPELAGALEWYRVLEEIYQQVRTVIASSHVNLDRQQIPQLMRLFAEAKQVEEMAIGEIKVVQAEVLANRYVNYYQVIEG